MTSGQIFWPLASVARWLNDVCDGRRVFALAPPSWASWRRLDASSNNAVYIADWFYDYIDQELFAGFFPGENGDGENLRDYWPPLRLAGSFSRDRFVVSEPLLALVNSSPQKRNERVAVRSIDDLAGRESDCKALVVGSGKAALDLLAGSIRLISDFAPIIVVDAVALTHRHSVPLSPDDVLRLLPRYRFLALQPDPDVRRASQLRARMLVLVPEGRTISPPSDAAWSENENSECLAQDIVVLSGGRKDAVTGRIAWTGRAAGLAVMLERPAGSKFATVFLKGAIPYGLRAFVDNELTECVLDASNKEREAPAFTLRFQLPDEAKNDRLMTLLLNPIRHSTTMRPERIELFGICFSD